MAETSPIEVTKALKGMDFPASKNDVVHHAESHGAGREVVDKLKELPDEKYGTIKDVMKAFGKER